MESSEALSLGHHSDLSTLAGLNPLGLPRTVTLLAAFPLNWLETTFLLVIWVALGVDVMRQHWLSRGAKIAWLVFIILVPIVSWIAYGIVRHRHGVGPGR